MGNMISYKRPDGQSVSGYLAEPAKGAAAPGMVVIQEWWGLNDQIKGVADKLAAAGYRALVPDSTAATPPARTCAARSSTSRRQAARRSA